MKRSTYILLLLLITSVIAIILINDFSIKRELNALHQEVMQLHSKVSPKLDGIIGLENSLKARLKALETQGRDKKEMIERYAASIKELEDINEGIQRWRTKMAPTTWKQQKSREALVLLKGAKQEIQEISERVEEAIEKIEDMLKQEQEEGLEKTTSYR